MFKLKEIKLQVILFLSLFAVYLSIQTQDFAFLYTSLTAVAAALAAELIFSFLLTKRFSLSDSPIITGLIIGFVISSDERLWVFAAASIFAIGSKFLFRIKNKHIFNPAAFGSFLAIILFAANTQWKGTYLWIVLLPFGLYFIYKINKLELLSGYALVSLILFGIQAVIQKVPLWNIFGYFSYFFIFIMLIEPKTTPVKPKGKFLFGLGAGALIFILTQSGMMFDVELAGLLIMNMAVPLLNKIP